LLSASAAAVAGEQRLVTGIGDRRLFEHGGGLGALAAGAQRLAIGQSNGGVLGVGAIAFAVDFDGAARIVGSGVSLRRQRARHIGHGLAAAEICGQYRRHCRGCEKPGKAGPGKSWPGEAGLSAHGSVTHDIGRDGAERASRDC
jgi:hypothetical protein